MMVFQGPVTCDGKFSGEEVAELRSELIQSGLDHWQAAELIASFLAARGYGISTVTARDALTRIGTSHCSVDYMYQELEQLALVM